MPEGIPCRAVSLWESSGTGGAQAVTPEDAAEAMGEQQLAPGVHGWLFDTANGIYIPFISADKPGTGDVARFLDSLPRDRAVKFPTVLSAPLRGMLLRRG